MRVRTYCLTGFYEASVTSTRNQHHGTGHVEACRPRVLSTPHIVDP